MLHRRNFVPFLNALHCGTQYCNGLCPILCVVVNVLALLQPHYKLHSMTYISKSMFSIFNSAGGYKDVNELLNDQ